LEYTRDSIARSQSMLMRDTEHGCKGFTLLEVITVTVIVAILMSMGLLAFNQASDRRQSSHADQLLIWLQQLSEQSALSGVAYGVINNKSDLDRKLEPLVYFRNRWLLENSIPPFIIDADAEVRWNVSERGGSNVPFYSSVGGIPSAGARFNLLESDPLPIFAFMSYGYMEPDGALQMIFEKSSVVYKFFWDSKNTTVKMIKVNQL